MKMEEKHTIANLFMTDEGKLLMELFTDTIVKHTDIRTLGDKDPKVVAEAIDMFTSWVQDVLGAKEDFEHDMNVKAKRKLWENNQLYRVEAEGE